MQIRAALVLFLALLSPAAAVQTAWQEVAPGVRLRLIAGDVLKPDGTTLVGLEIDMPENTKTYWRVPGETGIPTRIDITGSTGIAAHQILWPYPTIDNANGFLDYVYFGPTVLPVELQLTGEAATLQASVMMGVCSDICMPVTASFELPLAFASPDRAQELRVTQALALTPLLWDEPRDAIGEVRFDAAAGALAVWLSDPRVDPMSLIADAGADGQLFGTPQKSPDTNLVLFPLLGGNGDESVAGLPVQLTFMTEMGPFSVSRRVLPAGSTAARQ